MGKLSIESGRMNLWTHVKTGHTYVVHGTVRNSTNDQDGQLMVRYQRCVTHEVAGIRPIGDEFVREATEFCAKFAKWVTA